MTMNLEGTFTMTSSARAPDLIEARVGVDVTSTAATSNGLDTEMVDAGADAEAANAHVQSKQIALPSLDDLLQSQLPKPLLADDKSIFILPQLDAATESSDTGGLSSKEGDGNEKETTVLLLGDTPLPLSIYLGPAYNKLIYDFVDARELPLPGTMLDDLTTWQRKGASQIHHSCHSRFRGGIVGDQPGVGKTRLAILCMELAREEPGSFCLVVCPKSCQMQWVMEIAECYKPEHMPKVLILDDPHKDPHEIRAERYEIVIVSYEWLESNHRAKQKYIATQQAYQRGENDGPTKVPTAALFSDVWKKLNLPIKRVVLDECHRIKNDSGSRYAAVKALFYHSIIMMSGTFAHNKWSDVASLIPLLRGHCFTTPLEFVQAFTHGENIHTTSALPQVDDMKMLVKFLMAFTIARPNSVLKLKGLLLRAVVFNLNEEESRKVAYHEREFQRNIGGHDELDDTTTKDGNPFYHCVRAQQYAAHLVLGDLPAKDLEGVRDAFDQDIADVFVTQIEERTKPKDRKKWLSLIQQPTFDVSSSRVDAFLMTYTAYRQQYPTEKILVFSEFLRFLDIIAQALLIKCSVEALRYDGTCTSKDREVVRDLFTKADPSVPLLLTSRAGGEALNLQCASIIIQTETWWNSNNEAQASARAYRKGQEKSVKHVLLIAVNSEIDETIMGKKQSKSTTINQLNQFLIRHHEDPIEIPEL